MNSRRLVSIIRELSIALEPVPVGELPLWTVSRRIPVRSAGPAEPQAGNNGISAVLFDVYGTLFISGSGDIGTTEEIESAEILGKLMLDAVFKILKSQRPDPEPHSDAGFTSGRVGMHAKKILFEVIKKMHAEIRSAGIKYPEVDIRSVWKEVIAELDSLGIEGFPAGIADVESTEKYNTIVEELAVKYECGVNPVWPMPGSGELINFLKDKKVPIGIISNAQFYTPLIFEALLGSVPEELGFSRELLFFSYSFGEAKPSAAMFKSAVRVLEKNFNIASDSVLYIGNDMLNDIKPAKDAGFTTVLFAGDERSLRLREDEPQCRGILPELVITDLREIERLF